MTSQEPPASTPTPEPKPHRFNPAKTIKMGLVAALITVLTVAAISAYANFSAPATSASLNQSGDENQPLVSRDVQAHRLERAATTERHPQNRPFPQHSPPGPATSVILAKNPGDETITILTRDLRTLTVQITPDTTVYKNTATSNDTTMMYDRLAVGDLVHGRVTTEGSETHALDVRAFTPGQITARGTLTQIAANSVTFTSPKNSTITLTVDTNPSSPTYTVIHKNREAATLGDLSTGDHAALTFLVKPDETLQVIILATASPVESI